jgi:hypothetical protein
MHLVQPSVLSASAQSPRVVPRCLARSGLIHSRVYGCRQRTVPSLDLKRMIGERQVIKAIELAGKVRQSTEFSVHASASLALLLMLARG